MLFLILATTWAYAQETIIPTLGLITDPYHGVAYQQQKYDLEGDLQGNYSLQVLGKLNSKAVQYVLTGKKHLARKILKEEREAYELYKDYYPQWDFNPIESSPIDHRLTQERIDRFPISQKSKDWLIKNHLNTRYGFTASSKPFVPKRILRMFLQVMREEYDQNSIEASLGQEHVWSQEFVERYASEFPVIRWRISSKLFTALSNGVTSRYMVTEKEKELAEFITAHPEESVTLEQVFRKSYQLNYGDMYLTLLTIENLLSYHWNTSHRDQAAVVKRLAPITHYFNRGDKYGHWYHFFGMLLYGYARGTIRGYFVAKIEPITSLGHKDPQEEKINIFGGAIGPWIKKAVKNRTYRSDEFKSNPKYLSSDYYLRKFDIEAALQKKMNR